MHTPALFTQVDCVTFLGMRIFTFSFRQFDIQAAAGMPRYTKDTSYTGGSIEMRAGLTLHCALSNSNQNAATNNTLKHRESDILLMYDEYATIIR